MIIATAGHVDHGKTSLVRTLTGTDTDRNPEEKKRGLTIDIGFAYMRDRNGQNVAVIDVPGHEKFVRNMISGVGLVDIALLVVAADDGPMPQTIEHIAILKLMSVKLIVPVISKTDLVSSERQAQVIEELTVLLRDAGLPCSDFYPMSVLDKKAVLNLQENLVSLIGSMPRRHVRGQFRMPIDRCFTLDGSGTVVTGTVSSGEIEKNQNLSLISGNSTESGSARARGIHAQSTESDNAVAGQRCAINLSGNISRDVLRRGSWLVANPSAVRTKIIDVVLTAAFNSSISRDEIRASKVSHWTPAHLHLGTADIPCRIALLESADLSYGETALARLMCERDFTAAHGDRFVLRDQSARMTIAGGSVLDVLPPRRGRSKPARLEQLAALNVETAAEAMNNLLAIDDTGVELDKFALRFNLLATETEEIVKKNNLLVVATTSSHWCLTRLQSEALEEKILVKLLQYHKDHPAELGVGAEVIFRAIDGKINREVLEHHLKVLIQRKKVVRVASVYRHDDHQVSMNKEDDGNWTTVERELLSAGLSPRRLTELAVLLEKEVEETRQFMNRCVAHGKVFKVTDNRYFLPSTLKHLADVAKTLSTEDKLTVAEFRNQTGIGRNLVVELLEYFDRCRFTRRLGNKRIVLTAVTEAF